MEPETEPTPLQTPTYVNRKGETRAKLLEYILSFCDTDIQERFSIHGFTIEPLLMQLLRDINALKKG